MTRFRQALGASSVGLGLGLVLLLTLEGTFSRASQVLHSEAQRSERWGRLLSGSCSTSSDWSPQGKHSSLVSRARPGDSPPDHSGLRLSRASSDSPMEVSFNSRSRQECSRALRHLLVPWERRDSSLVQVPSPTPSPPPDLFSRRPPHPYPQANRSGPCPERNSQEAAACPLFP